MVRRSTCVVLFGESQNFRRFFGAPETGEFRPRVQHGVETSIYFLGQVSNHSADDRAPLAQRSEDIDQYFSYFI